MNRILKPILVSLLLSLATTGSAENWNVTVYGYNHLPNGPDIAWLPQTYQWTGYNQLSVRFLQIGYTDDGPVYDFSKPVSLLVGEYDSAYFPAYTEKDECPYVVFKKPLPALTGFEINISGETIKTRWDKTPGATHYGLSLWDYCPHYSASKRVYFGADRIAEPIKYFGDLGETTLVTSITSGNSLTISTKSYFPDFCLSVSPLEYTPETFSSLGEDNIKQICQYGYCDNFGKGDYAVGVFDPASMAVPSEETLMSALTSYLMYPVGDYSIFYTFNGEPLLNWALGEVPSADAYYPIWNTGEGDELVNQENLRGDYVWNHYAWRHYYSMISRSNKFLEMAEEYGWNNDVAKGNAHALRAYAYLRLMQVFAPRFEDSENEGRAVLPIFDSMKAEEEGRDLAAYRDVMQFIYTELDQAIDLLGTSPKQTWTRGITRQGAKAIYARAALLRHDWRKAREMASGAREGFRLLSEKEYLAGFYRMVPENWIWGLETGREGDKMDIGFTNYGTYMACNGAYPALWGCGSGAINYDLYRKMQDGDFRRKLYFTPEKAKKGTLSFWNSKFVNPETMDLNQNVKQQLATSYAATIKPSDEIPDAFSFGSRDCSEQMIISFGQQFKFWAEDSDGRTDYPLIRTEEMLLTEAEAAFMEGDEAGARTLLDELNTTRISDYAPDPSLTGDNLLDAIRIARRIELWGEGHSWFDLKRWNLPMVRRAWVEGDKESGNIPTTAAVTVSTDANMGWCHKLPEYATSGADETQAPISEVCYALEKTRIAEETEVSDAAKKIKGLLKGCSMSKKCPQDAKTLLPAPEMGWRIQLE